MRDADKSTDIKHWFAQRAKADEQAHCRRQTDVRAQCLYKIMLSFNKEDDMN